MLVSCFFLQTLTEMSSLLGLTPTTMPAYTGHAGADEQRAALLGVEQAVGDGLAGLEGHQGAGVPAAGSRP